MSGEQNANKKNSSIFFSVGSSPLPPKCLLSFLIMMMGISANAQHSRLLSIFLVVSDSSARFRTAIDGVAFQWMWRRGKRVEIKSDNRNWSELHLAPIIVLNFEAFHRVICVCVVSHHQSSEWAIESVARGWKLKIYMQHSTTTCIYCTAAERVECQIFHLPLLPAFVFRDIYFSSCALCNCVVESVNERYALCRSVYRVSIIAIERYYRECTPKKKPPLTYNNVRFSFLLLVVLLRILPLLSLARPSVHQTTFFRYAYCRLIQSGEIFLIHFLLPLSACCVSYTFCCLRIETASFLTFTRMFEFP